MVNVHESDYEQYNEYSFHFGLLFFRFLQIEQTDLDQFVGHVFGEGITSAQGLGRVKTSWSGEPIE